MQREPWRVDALAVAESLQSDIQSGLTSEVAAERLEQFGPNVLEAVRPPVPAWRKFLRQFRDR